MTSKEYYGLFLVIQLFAFLVLNGSFLTSGNKQEDSFLTHILLNLMLIGAMFLSASKASVNAKSDTH